MRLMPHSRSLIGLVATTATVLALSACGSSGDDGSGNASGASGDLDTVKVGIVPTLSLGFLNVGVEQGYFEDEGLELDITPVDSGPNVITGLVAGQYDLGYTAYAPPLVALAGGQDLRLVEHLGDHGAEGENGGVFVPKDSEITRWRDLEGAKLGTNAPRSLGVLWVQSAIAADGGDPSTLELVPLPFNQIAGNVESGQLDAGISLEPYLTQGLDQYDTLRNLGDPASVAIPSGTPSGGLFTVQATLDAKPELIERFRSAYAKTIEYGNEHLDEVRAAGAELSGLSAEDAELIALDPVDTDVTAEDFEPLLTALVEFGWTEDKVDIAEFLGS